MPSAAPVKKIAVIGGGPAGLMAAQSASGQGHEVHVYERKASVGRKFLIAGRGGMNLSHSEAFEPFCARFGAQGPAAAAWLKDFDNDAIRAWAKELGIETFIGSSGRIFPSDMKAAPLLRAWLKKLREAGVQFHVNQQCLGFSDAHTLRMLGPGGEQTVQADAFILALGGGSWPQLGSDGSWVPWLKDAGVDVAELQAANCGFDVSWTDHFRNKFAGHALKPLRIGLTADGSKGLQGECVISEYGIEGSLIYALSRRIREAINGTGECIIHLDLLPDHSPERVQKMLARSRNGRSLTDILRRLFALPAVKTGLIHELADRTRLADADYLAKALKQLPLRLLSPRPIAEAISTAGGVTLAQLDRHLMLKGHPGMFIAGEMLDWEAPTGGYLLSASMASGRLAGLGALAYLSGSASDNAG
jgi:uncharacterized flavoprotein (TIGR03862 family)